VKNNMGQRNHKCSRILTSAIFDTRPKTIFDS
jgi:hypothetical protein